MTNDRCSVCNAVAPYGLDPPAVQKPARYCRAHLPAVWGVIGARWVSVAPRAAERRVARSDGQGDLF